MIPQGAPQAVEFFYTFTSHITRKLIDFQPRITVLPAQDRFGRGFAYG